MTKRQRLFTFTFALLLMFAGPRASESAVFDAENLCDAIYRAEGGLAARKPFGVLSVPCYDYGDCRDICLNTVENNFTRWQIQGSPGGDFIRFLGLRYCPPGHCPDTDVWIRNVKYFLRKDEKGN